MANKKQKWVRLVKKFKKHLFALKSSKLCFGRSLKIRFFLKRSCKLFSIDRSSISQHNHKQALNIYTSVYVPEVLGWEPLAF